ncbi:unnamed protein product [Sympodiomycopsis kandeliae]
MQMMSSSEDSPAARHKRRRLTPPPEDEDDQRDQRDQGQESDQDSQESEVSPRPPVRPITRLEESVVNRIAAGEIIHRPSNALKELIENSLDAGSDMIRVTLKDGGLKLLQIQDNGHGVPVSDLPLLCERFATSKLRDFDDLSRMQTFGFRGEALASISFVSASMSVITKTKEEKMAWKAFYSSGHLTNPKSGSGSSSSSPKPCAGTDGTTITAEDLFYNVPQRRRALKSAAEEYNRCLDVVAKYALHYGSRGIGFVCKKQGSNTTDLSTPSSPSTTTLDTIRLLYGNTIARELIHLPPTHNTQLGFSATGWLSSANHSSAKRSTTFFCFINNRLVDCSTLKRSIEAIYSAILPRGSHPWIYIALGIDPRRVDVNVHPTKKEVHFLDEDEVIEVVCQNIQGVLANANKSRSFNLTQQTLLPGANTASSQGPASQSQYPQHQVRVDAKTRTLISMFGQNPSSDPVESQDDEEAVGDGDVPPSTQATQSRSRNVTTSIPLAPCTLTSISNLRSHIASSKHSGLLDILCSHTFVGVVDMSRSLSLIQNGTKLYLVNHDLLIEDFIYQSVLRQFGALNKHSIQTDATANGLDVQELVELGIQLEGSEEAESSTGLSTDKISQRITEQLNSVSEMLLEYFSIDIQKNSTTRKITLNGLPSILPNKNLIPPTNLPTLLMRLGLQVNYQKEQECFSDIATEISFAHNLSTLPDDQIEWGNEIVRYTYFPLFKAAKRNGFLPSRELFERQDTGEEVCIQLAALSDLYRIFERC